ncbi:LLM class flavin-dependent oxidoreductase [Streptomyces sp. L7]
MTRHAQDRTGSSPVRIVHRPLPRSRGSPPQSKRSASTACGRATGPWYPRTPRTPTPAEVPYPRSDRTFLDPVVTLSFLAHATRRLRLGTSTLNAPFYSPLLLARSLVSLDILSGGRLDVGFGLGWSSDEYEAIGVPWQGRGARLEEILDVLEHVWSGSPAEYKGELWTIPSAHIETLPVQRPRLPVLLGGFTPATLERIGRRADGSGRSRPPGAPTRLRHQPDPAVRGGGRTVTPRPCAPSSA